MNHYNNAGLWREFNIHRPWYKPALSLLPDCHDFSVIELGSGAGEMARLIKPLVRKITCLDLSSTYIKKLKQAGFEAIKADCNKKLPINSHQFNLTISLELIEHLTEVEFFLNEIKRILKPQGYLLISTPNIAWWGYRLGALVGWPPEREGYHLRFFTHNTFTSLLNQSGFKIIKSNSFTTIPWLNRLLIKLKLKPIHPMVSFWPNLLAQDLVFLCQKKELSQ